MLSSSPSLQTKQGNSIPMTCCIHFPIPQRHLLHLCMVGIQLDLWTDASPMLASIAHKPVLPKILYVILSTAIGRQLLGESKLPPFGNIVKTVWLQLASKRPTASIPLKTSRRHLCKSKLPYIKHSATKPLASAHLFRFISFKTNCNSEIVKGCMSGKPLADVSSSKCSELIGVETGVRRKDVTKKMSKFFCIRFWWFTIGTFWLHRHSDKSLQTIQWSKFLQYRFNSLSSLSDEVFSEFLSELFLIFPLFVVCMLLPSFRPAMIENNHREIVVAMCLLCSSSTFAKQHTYKQSLMTSNPQVVFVKNDSKFDDTMLAFLFHPALASNLVWSDGGLYVHNCYSHVAKIPKMKRNVSSTRGHPEPLLSTNPDLRTCNTHEVWTFDFAPVCHGAAAHLGHRGWDPTNILHMHEGHIIRQVLQPESFVLGCNLPFANVLPPAKFRHRGIP